eukprot:scaffold468794_cov86-Attheya_sp.AAC.1
MLCNSVLPLVSALALLARSSRKCHLLWSSALDTMDLESACVHLLMSFINNKAASSRSCELNLPSFASIHRMVRELFMAIVALWARRVAPLARTAPSMHRYQYTG